MSQFSPGQKVPTSGIYRAVHYRHRESDREITFVAGQIFPRCSQCDELVEFQLVQGVPSIAEDPDFRGNSV
jgi:hypothetical protein